MSTGDSARPASRTTTMPDPSRSIAFLAQTQQLPGQLDTAAIGDAEKILLECYRKHGRVYTMGNGGSASTAQHFACDLAKYVIPTGQRPFDVRCLTDNVSLYTAWANDAAREDVFTNQMRGFLRKDDVLIVISVHGGKGFSVDLVKAVRYANKIGARSISLVGFDGGMLHKECTCSILVPVDSTPQTEAIHLVIEQTVMNSRMDEKVTTDLTGRELDVLTLLARGKSNKEIGTNLYISETTVKSHLRSIFTNSRTEAITAASRRGLVQI